MRQSIVLTIFALLLMPGLAQAQNDDGIPDNCEYTNVPYEQPNLFPRYDVNNHRLVLVDWTTGSVAQEIETSLNTDYFMLHDWSPDCRYLSARVGGLGETIWDMVNGRRVASFSDARPTPNIYTRRQSPIIWNPISTYALIEGERGNAYLLNLTSGISSEIAPATGYNFTHAAWNDRYLFTVRYDNAGFITVYDLQTGSEVLALDRGFPVSRLVISPDGRYLAASGYHRTYIWDTTRLPGDDTPLYTHLVGAWGIKFTSNTTLEIRTRHFSTWRYNLSTGTGRRIFRPREAYFVNDPTNQYTFVNIDDDLYLRRLDGSGQFPLNVRQRIEGEPYWDYEHNRVFTALTGGSNIIFAFDLQTGAKLNEYPLPNSRGPATFTFSPDGSKIIVFTDSRRGWGARGKQAGAVVYDVGRGAGIGVDVDDFAAHSPDQIALSPDNRYLVIARVTLRVWDLANLPDDLDARDPIYRHEGPDAYIIGVRFIDNATLETTDAYGIVQRWDLYTGANIP